jgi:hypothetical protein
MVHQAEMRLADVSSFLMLCFAAGAPSVAATVEQSRSFGTIALIEEVRTREPDEPLIMHVATEWTKLHLRWRSEDSSLIVNLTDDGGMLQINVKTGFECFLSAPYQRFRTGGEPALWQAMTTAARDLLRACPRVRRTAALSYLRELGQSATDFQTGVAAMKSRSILLWGKTLKRCRPQPVTRQPMIITDPFASRCDGRW